ncbi:MAG: hypothetical protein KatS3mg087_0259 [Patescibacteria group bacterium]|nr:MAG: hypothetical protein KatS3mg087_0259 [Patescibacteria group bacterium]
MERVRHQSAGQTPRSASGAEALAAALRRVEQLEALVGELLAGRVQLRAQLTLLQDQLAAVEDARQTTHQELLTLKQAPFRARRRREPASGTPRGRAVGHPGSSRKRPLSIDQHERVGAGEHCPDCGTSFIGKSRPCLILQKSS